MRGFVFGVMLLAATVAIADEQSELGKSLKDIEVAPHWIYDDFPRAVAEAKKSGKPLLVVLRCVPCPPGKTLDEQVMRPNPQLEAVEKKFVCVRVIQANQLDLTVFQYDFDMSWSAVFLNSDMTVYGRYGSRNASGKDTSDGLLSVKAFQKAAERALALHANYPANKAELAGKIGPKPEWTVATQIPGLGDKPVVATERRNCIHCHMVKEFALRAKWEQGRLTPEDLYVFPLPENIGISTDLDDGLKVSAVAPNSAAAKADVKPGDELASINGQTLISLADIQWALHTAAANQPLAVKLRRGGQTVEKSIAPQADWKESDLAWRASSWYGLRKGLEVTPLSAEDRQSRGIAPGSLALLVKNIYGQGEHPVKKAGLAKNDVIVAVDGQTAAMTESEFLANLRLKHGPKDSLKLVVLRGSDRKELVVPMW